MAGLVDQILLNIKASVTGAAGVSALSGEIGGLTARMVALNQGVQIVQQVTAVVGGLVNQMGEYARKADAATISARSWQTVLTNFNVNVTEAERVIGDLVDRTGASEIALKGAAAQYIKMGGTLADFEKGALAAASSWSDLTVKTITLDESINNVTLGLAQGRSELMESSGIVVNASQAWEKYADSVGKSVKDLTDQEKAHAYAVAVYREEELGILNLAEKQTDLTRAENASTRAKEEMGRAIGAVVLPTYTKLVQGSADVARTVTDMVNAYRQGGQAMDTFAQKNPQLAAVMERVRVVVTALRDTAREVFEQSIAPMLDRLAPQAQRVAGVFAPAMDRIQAVLLDLGGIARQAIEQVLIPLFEAVAPVVMQVVQRIVPLLASAAEAFRDWAQMVVTAWQTIAVPVIRAIAPYVSMAVDAVANALGSVIQVVKSVIGAVTAAINGDWSKAWAFLKNAVGTATLAVQSILEGLWKILSDIAVKAWDSAKRIGLNLKDGMIAGLAGLGEKLARELNAALDQATTRLPDWAKRILGITALQGLIDYAGDAAGAAATQAGSAITRRTQAETQAQIRQEVSGLDANSFSLKVWQQAFQSRGDKLADTFVNYCLRWVRDTLGDAQPALRGAIDKLMQANPERRPDGTYIPTARSAARNMEAAGLMRTYTGTQNLKPGDTVFYTDGGQNHVGIYIGDGQVRGNNLVTFKTNGGKFDAKGNPIQGTADPVGNVGINQLGRVSGYVSTADLEAYLRQKPVSTAVAGSPTTPPPATASVVTPVTPPTTKDLKDYSLTLADWNKNQARALELAREAEKAESDLTGVRGIQVKTAMERWAGEDKARQQSYQLAVQLTARRAAEEKRIEQDADQRVKEQAQLRARIADQNRQLTVSAAKQLQDRLAILNRAELEAFKGTAAERLELIRRQSQDEYLARMRVAAATRDKEIREAENMTDLPQATRDEMIRQARQRYENTRLEQQAVRTEAVRQAQVKLNEELKTTADSTAEALANLDEYLAGSGEAARAAATALPDVSRNYQELNERITDLQGDLANKGTAEAWIEAIEDMGRRGELTAAQVANLTARIRDLAQAPIDEINRAQDALGDLNDRTASEAVTAARALDELGDREGAVQKLNDALGEVLANGGPVGPAVSAIVAELDRLNASVDQGALRRGAELLERWKAATEDGTASAPAERYTETADGYEANVDGAFSQAMTDVFQGSLPDQLRQAVQFTLTDVFQNAGQESREQFWEEFSLLTQDPDFDKTLNGLGTDVLLGLSNGMGDNPQWAALKAKVDARLDEIFKPGDAQAPSKLSALVDDIAKAVDGAQAKYDLGAISAEDFSGVLTAQETVLARVLERLEKLGPEYADAANSVRLLLGAVQQLNADLPEMPTIAADLAPTALEDRAAGVGDQVAKLALDFRAGAITAQEFNAAAVNIIPTLEILARLAEAQGDSKLAAELRQLKVELEALGGPALKAMQGALKFNEYAGYVQSLAGAFGQLADAVSPGGDLGANLSGIANLTGKLISGVQGVMQGFAQGGIVGGVVAGVSWLASTIADAVSGFQRAKQAAEDARKSFQSAFKLVDASTFSTFGTRSRGFFADLFGGGPEVIQQVNEVAASIARTLESGVSGAFQNGIKRFLNGEGSVLDGLRSGIRDTVVNAITEAIIQGTVIKGALGGLLTDLTNTLAGGGDASGIISQIGATLPTVAATLEATLSPLIGTLNAALGSNTQAVNANTKALNEAQFQQTTVVEYRDVGDSGRVRARLAGL